jgi:hypothetical protein
LVAIWPTPEPPQEDEEGTHKAPPAGFQFILPERSRRIRASGEFVLVKRASSPASGWVAHTSEARITIRKHTARRMSLFIVVLLLSFFTETWW